MIIGAKYLAQMKANGVKMTAYVANTLIKVSSISFQTSKTLLQVADPSFSLSFLLQAHASQNDMESARNVFESMSDPAPGVAAEGNHLRERHPKHVVTEGATPATDTPIYREPSTW